MRPDSVSSEQNGFFKGYCILGDVWTSRESRGRAGEGEVSQDSRAADALGLRGGAHAATADARPVVLLSGVLAEPGSRKTGVLG